MRISAPVKAAAQRLALPFLVLISAVMVLFGKTDLLLYDDEVSDDSTLTLPHPRMHERAFVLAPLAEIAPGLNIPGKGHVLDLLAQCADQQIQRME